MLLKLVAGFQAGSGSKQLNKMTLNIGCMTRNKLLLEVIEKVKELKFVSCLKHGTNVISFHSLPGNSSSVKVSKQFTQIMELFYGSSPTKT